MKTRQYITAMLIALIFGIVSIQAQSTRHAAPQQKNERATATRTNTHTRQATPQKASTVQATKQVQHQRTVQPAHQAQKPQAQKPQVQKQQVQRQQVEQQQVQRQRTVEPVRQAQKPQVQRQQVQRQQVEQQQVQRQRTTQPAKGSVSISTPNNSRSTYRNTNSTVNVNNNRTVNNRVNKFSTERYYGGNHYHYVYPTRKVNFNYHHDTYLHNYHVLYYPTYTNIYWSRNMYNDYHRWYPQYQWRYNYGYSIQTISAFDAKYNLGEVAMIYGRVYATWHNMETDDYLLFFGGDYPNQQFTVVLPGNVARRFSWRPERYFLGEHLTVTGLITTFDGIPEVIVKNKRQVGLY